ncbi:MAG: hypothetical protein U1E48_11385 [Paracoccaceae bacterium]
MEGEQNSTAALAYLEQMATGPGANIDAKVALLLKPRGQWPQ